MKPPICISVVTMAPSETLSELAQYSVLNDPFNIILPSMSGVPSVFPINCSMHLKSPSQ